jgi:hypothetical protein
LSKSSTITPEAIANKFKSGGRGHVGKASYGLRRRNNDGGMRYFGGYAIRIVAQSHFGHVEQPFPFNAVGLLGQVFQEILAAFSELLVCLYRIAGLIGNRHLSPGFR